MPHDCDAAHQHRLRASQPAQDRHLPVTTTREDAAYATTRPVAPAATMTPAATVTPSVALIDHPGVAAARAGAGTWRWGAGAPANGHAR
jgi:hypothetical protein